ncbi:MAG: hypothetical protein U0792_12170 [Gemmataceae bacterium]
MQTLLRSFTLFAALVGVTTITGLPAAPAQVKDKKDDKADPKAEEAGTVEVYKAKDGWRFRIKGAGGKSLAIGTVGFEKKEDALKTLDAIKATLAKGKVIEMKEDKK